MPGYGELCALYVDPNYWAEALALHLCLLRVLSFSDWDFETRFSGYSKATFGQSASIGRINGSQMERSEAMRCGALRLTICAIGATLMHQKTDSTSTRETAP